ncbi:hypothetical protein HY967_00900 [Candidatus Jorgensenbacteria bacterium]|nr:hypothetical protein [Candidatus Jorgensenbacteria bacterium]
MPKQVRLFLLYGSIAVGVVITAILFLGISVRDVDAIGFRIWEARVATTTITTTASYPGRGYAVATDPGTSYVYVGGENLGNWRVEKWDESAGSFSDPLWAATYVNGVAYTLARDGSSLYAVGESNGAWRVERLNAADGNLIWAVASVNGSSTAVAVDATSVYVSGYSSDDGLWRVEKRDKATGNLDLSFGNAGVAETNIVSGDVYALALDGSGNLYAAGVDTSVGAWAIEKYNVSTGVVDVGFSANSAVQAGIATTIAAGISDDLYVGVQLSSGGWRITKLFQSAGGPYPLWNRGIQPTGKPRSLSIDAAYVYVVGETTSGAWRIEKRQRSTGDLCHGTFPIPCDGIEFGSGGFFTSATGTAWSVVVGQSISGNPGIHVVGNDNGFFGGRFARLRTFEASDGYSAIEFSGVLTPPPTTTTTDVPVAGQVKSVAIDPFGNMYAAGYGAGNQQILEKRKSKDGQLLSRANSGSSFAVWPGVLHAAVSDDDALYVGGQTDDTYSPMLGVWYVRKYDHNLTTQWIKTSDPFTMDSVRALALYGGDIYAAGVKFNGGFCSDCYYEWRVERRNASDGALLQAAKVGTSGSDQAGAYAIAVDSGYIYVGGSHNNQWEVEKRDRTTLALQSGWPKNAGSGFASGVALDATYLYAVGWDSTNSKGRLEKRNKSDGALVSGFGTGGAGYTLVDITRGVTTYSVGLSSVGVDDTGIYIAGSALMPSGDNEWFIEKRDLTTGLLLWRQELDATASRNDGIGAMAVDVGIAPGTIYVGGYNSDTSNRAEWGMGKLVQTLEGGEPVRAAHVQDLQREIDRIREKNGKSAYTWSGNAAPGNKIRASDITEMQTAYDDGCGVATPWNSITGVISRMHFNELGNAVGTPCTYRYEFLGVYYGPGLRDPKISTLSPAPVRASCDTGMRAECFAFWRAYTTSSEYVYDEYRPWDSRITGSDATLQRYYVFKKTAADYTLDPHQYYYPYDSDQWDLNHNGNRLPCDQDPSHYDCSAGSIPGRPTDPSWMTDWGRNLSGQEARYNYFRTRN